MIRRLGPSIQSTIYGVVISLGGSGIFASAFLLMVMGITRYEHAMDHYAAHIQSTGIMLTLLVGDFLFAALGGYLGARKAKCHEFLHALIIGIISVNLARFNVLAYPEWYRTATVFLIVPIALLSGFIAGKMNERIIVEDDHPAVDPDESHEPEHAEEKIKTESIVPKNVPVWVMVLSALVITVYLSASWRLIYAVSTYYEGQKKGAAKSRQSALVSRIVSRVFSGFENIVVGNDRKKIFIFPGEANTLTFYCLALPVQDAQGCMWCIRKDRPSDLACWDGEQWHFAELKDIAADPRGPSRAAILIDDKQRVHVVSNYYPPYRGWARYYPDEIDVDALKEEYKQDMYPVIDKYLFYKMGLTGYGTRKPKKNPLFGYGISTLSAEEIREMFSSMLYRRDLCSVIDTGPLGLDASFLVQKVQQNDSDTTPDMVAAVNRLLFTRMYPRTFAKTFMERAYRLESSSMSAVEVFPDPLSMLIDSTQSGSRVFGDNANHPPLVFDGKLFYNGRYVEPDTRKVLEIGKDAKACIWQDNIVAVQSRFVSDYARRFAYAARHLSGDKGRAFLDASKRGMVPYKCVISGRRSNGVPSVAYEDNQKQQNYSILPDKCLIGIDGIRELDKEKYDSIKNGTLGPVGKAFYPMRRYDTSIYVFENMYEFERSSSAANISANAVRLPEYIDKITPCDHGFTVATASGPAAFCFGKPSSRPLNERMIGQEGIRYFNREVFESNSGKYFPARQYGDDLYVFSDIEGFLRAGSTGTLPANAAKLPGYIDRVYPFAGGFSYFDPVSEHIVLCSSGGFVSEIKTNDGLIGKAGIQLFDEKVYETNRGALFPVQRCSDDLYVFTSPEDYAFASVPGNIRRNAIKLPGYVGNIYPIPGGFGVIDHQSGKIILYYKKYVIETEPGFYNVYQLNSNSALFVDAKGNLWINTDERFLKIPRDEVFPQ